MNYIDELKAQNIKFVRINETEAEKILESEYSFFKIMEFSVNFDRYISTQRKGQFIDLDFSQLYYIAKIDERLCEIVMSLCLEMEQKLKTMLINDMIRVCDPNQFLSVYYRSDIEYLQNMYTPENFEILLNKYAVDDISQLEFFQFIDIVQFGTLERIIHSFYKIYSPQIYNSAFAPFEKPLSSVKRIRNIVAHNNSLLNQLKNQNLYTNSEISSFLGANGVKNKTLKTNFSKAIVFDLSNSFYMYFQIIPLHKGKYHIKELHDFDVEYCQMYETAWCKNDLLKSVYKFMKQEIKLCIEKFIN